jgi:hypothetical protein
MDRPHDGASQDSRSLDTRHRIPIIQSFYSVFAAATYLFLSVKSSWKDGREKLVFSWRSRFPDLLRGTERQFKWGVDMNLLE